MTKAKGRISSDREKRQWTKTVLRWRCSVVPSIFPRVIIFGLFGTLVSVLYKLNFPVSLPILSSIVPSVVLGLLLVFRTNTAYERFWEGRKLWGLLVNTVRNLARQIWVTVEEDDPAAHVRKEAILRLLVAFAVATKRHLRYEPVNEELAALVPESCYIKLKKMNSPPLEIAFWIGDYLQLEYKKNNINAYQLSSMFKLLDIMVDVLGGCERILKTPIPLAYSIHLKQLILLYCLALPFQLVNQLNW